MLDLTLGFDPKWNEDFSLHGAGFHLYSLPFQRFIQGRIVVEAGFTVIFFEVKTRSFFPLRSMCIYAYSVTCYDNNIAWSEHCPVACIHWNSVLLLLIKSQVVVEHMTPFVNLESVERLKINPAWISVLESCNEKTRYWEPPPQVHRWESVPRLA